MKSSSDHPSLKAQHVRISAGVALLLAVTVFPCLYLIFFIFPQSQHTTVDELGKLLAQQLGNSSAEQVAHNDTLSLSVVLHQLIKSPSVVYAAIYSADNQLLAEAGTPTEEISTEFTTYNENITVQNNIAGRVQLTLRTNAPVTIGIYSTSQLMWIMSAWLFLSLLLTAIWIAYVLHPNNPIAIDSETTVKGLRGILQTLNRPTALTPTQESTITADNSHWHITQSAVLVLEFSNLAVLLQQLNNKTMTKLVDECYTNMEMCAKLYNGNLSGWLGKNVVICFNGFEDETEHYFHAICCAELIIGLTNHLNERLIKSNLPRIKLQAALHIDDLLTDADNIETQVPKHMISEAVSIAAEICQHADNNQLLVSSDLYTSHAIAERLIVAEPHVVVLECINQPITTYAILDLQPTYRELLTRQIQQLIAMK